MPTVKVTIVKRRVILLQCAFFAFLLIGAAMFPWSRGTLTPYMVGLLVLLFLAYISLQAAPLTNILLQGEPYEVIATDSGLDIREFRRSRWVPWTNISTMEKSHIPFGNSLKEVLIVRDASGITQLQITRARQESSELKGQYRHLEEFIADRVGKKGVVTSGPLTTAPTNTTFVLVTKYKILGLGGLLLWLPCTYFAWNAPTGGPVVGSIFLGFAALGILLACLDKRYEVDERGVRSFWFSKCDELHWGEVRRIELVQGARAQGTRTQGTQALLIAGEHNKVELAAPIFWKEGGALLQFIQSQGEHYNIEWPSNSSN